MATVTETKVKTAPVTDAAAIHNAGINERYLRLKNAIDEQFEEAKAQATATRASTLAPERPMERVETPTQTVEYGHTRVDSELFTAATLDKTLERNAHLYAQPEISAPTPTVETAAETYSLNMSAVKKAVAAFVGTVAVMLTAIGINTQIIKATELKIAAVQQRNAEVVAQIAAIEEQIAYERSEEVIADFAQANGMVKGN
jgi:hypothetical protein